MGKSGTKTLYPPALMVHRDEQAGTPQGVNFRTQRGELRAVTIVAGEQDDAPHQRMAQTLPVERRQFMAGDVDHQRAVRDRRQVRKIAHRCSSIT